MNILIVMYSFANKKVATVPIISLDFIYLEIYLKAIL